MKNIIIILAYLISITSSWSQTITGMFDTYADREIQLFGYAGFDAHMLDKTTADEHGTFQLSYNIEDNGMGYLLSEDNKQLIVVLENNAVKLHGHSFDAPETVKTIVGEQNQSFEQYASEHPRREQTLSAWKYLEKIYAEDPLFAAHEIPKKSINAEKHRIIAEDSLFLAGLPPKAYVRWYLPLRRLVSSVGTITLYRTSKIPEGIAAFRAIDYTDSRLQKSGLLQQTIDSHFWLIENSGRSLDSVYIEMQTSIDVMVENLLADEGKLNEITKYMFGLLEKRSLFGASEYLALKLLNQQGCTINQDFASQLEIYRAMKIGNSAPDIDLQGDIYASGFSEGSLPDKWSDIDSKYTVVVFGASWCPQCQIELRSLAQHYAKWKQQGVEVLFVSLDKDEEQFKNYVAAFPFISYCDYQKWEGQAVKDYYVFATPTLFLLDKKREIILRPNSVAQMNAWVDWYLVQGNK